MDNVNNHNVETTRCNRCFEDDYYSGGGNGVGFGSGGEDGGLMDDDRGRAHGVEDEMIKGRGGD